ncbi:MAG: response regulator transcription factor [Acidimicrobiia bacterium]|nr:response regulator transcription factor [Acidimicrobiia bacterium]MDH5420603.1 response regulator transcription factor [Acidimicrobiia bacterium]MDH5503979.1 response regulator transcription factor [Acidimicrobiia bacterium]
MISVLLADDQQLIRTGLRLIIDAEPDLQVVGEAPTGREAIRLAQLHNPDVVLMDIRMPEMDGIAATAALVELNLAARVIMVTTFDPDEYVYDALLAGASGFLLKDTPADDLVAAVRVVAGGESVLSPQVTRRLIEHFNSRARPLPPPSPSIDHLTDREREVFLLMGKGMANSEIAEALFVSDTTVKTHVSHVLAKLGLRDRVQAVVFAYENGLVIPGSS